MNYEVPQFIKEETKLAGLVTFTQIGFLMVAFFIIFTLYYVLVFWLWAILSLMIASIFLALAFGVIEGLPVYKLIGSILAHFWFPKMYVWQKREKSTKIKNLLNVSSGSFMKKPLHSLSESSNSLSSILSKKKLQLKNLQTLTKNLDNNNDSK